jgi:hypothetical protein
MATTAKEIALKHLEEDAEFALNQILEYISEGEDTEIHRRIGKYKTAIRAQAFYEAKEAIIDLYDKI